MLIMALQQFGGQSFEFSVPECEFLSGSEARAMLNYDEAHFASNCGCSENGVLPNAFNHTLNCSNWTLRLSQSSLVSYDDCSAESIDTYMKKRSHDLGALHKTAFNRPTFGMSFVSPSTDRTPVGCYDSDCASGEEQSIGTHTSLTSEFSQDNSDVSDLEKTVTPPSYRADNTETLIQTDLQSEDFTHITGCLIESCSELVTNRMPGVDLCEKKDVLQNTNVTSCKAVDGHSNLLDLQGCGTSMVQPKQSSVMLDAVSKSVPLASSERPNDVSQEQQRVPSSCRNRGSPSADRQMTLMEANGDSPTKEGRVRKASTSRRRHTANKENVNPEIHVSSYKVRERGAKKLDFVPPVGDFRAASYSRSPVLSAASDSGIASHQESLWKTPQSSTVHASKRTRNAAVSTTEVFNCSSPQAVGDYGCPLQGNQHLEKLVVAADDSVISGSLNHSSIHEYCSSSARITKPNVTTATGKYERSSSTPVKDLSENKRQPSADEYQPTNADVGTSDALCTVKVPEMPPPVGLSGCGLSSMACHLSTGSLSDSSISELDLTYESTVQLSLPHCLNRQVGYSRKDSKKEATLAAVSTQTSALFDDDKSYPLHKENALTKQDAIEPDAYIDRRGPYIIVSPELRIDGVCCVGLSSHGTLLLHNPHSRWQCISLCVTQFSIDGRAEDQSICPFNVRPKVTVDPNSVEAVKVIFAPRLAGVYVAQLSLSNSLAQAGRPPVMVTLQAVAENPKVELVSSGSFPSQLQFTALPWGCETYECITLVNKGRSSIPVRLVITSSTPNCFVFDKRLTSSRRVLDNTSSSLGNIKGSNTAARTMIPMMHTCVMLGGDTDGAEYHHQIPVYFMAPRRSASKNKGRSEEITGTVVAEIDVPTNNARVLATLDVIGVVGTAKLHVPRDITPIQFLAGQVETKFLPIRNCGEIPLNIDLSFSDWSDLFAVHPSEIVLDPGTDSAVKVTFAAGENMIEAKYESYMMMHIKPDGPVYQVKLVSVKIDLALNRSTLADCGISLNTEHLRPVRDMQTLASAKPTNEIESLGGSKENAADFCGIDVTSNVLIGQKLKHQKSYLTSAARLNTDCKTISMLHGTGSSVSHIKSIATASGAARPLNLKSVIASDVASGKVLNVGNFHPEENYRMVLADVPSMSLGTDFSRNERMQKPDSKIQVSDHGFNCAYSNTSLRNTVVPNVTLAHVVSDSNIIQSADFSEHEKLGFGKSCQNTEWTVKPDKIVFSTIADSPSVNRITIENNTDHDLQFDVSWPAHILNVAPEHGVIRPMCSVLVYIGTVENVLKKTEQLPWSGSIQIMCSSQIKVISVFIQEKEALATKNLHSVTPKRNACDSPLSPLASSVSCSPIVAVTVPVVASLDATMLKQCLRFPVCKAGENIELQVEFTNLCSCPIKWSVSSISPAYVKRPAEISVHRMTYTIFWWPHVSGFIQPAVTDKVRVCFCAREAGHYSQCWQVQFDAQDMSKARQYTCELEMFGLTIVDNPSHYQPSLGNVSDYTIITQSGVPSTSPPVQDSFKFHTIKSADGMVSVSPKKLVFNESNKNTTQMCKVEMRNKGRKNYVMELSDVAFPFRIGYKTLTLRSGHFLRVPVEFTPQKIGQYNGKLVIKSDTGDEFTIQLYGVCV